MALGSGRGGVPEDAVLRFVSLCLCLSLSVFVILSGCLSLSDCFVVIGMSVVICMVALALTTRGIMLILEIEFKYCSGIKTI